MKNSVNSKWRIFAIVLAVLLIQQLVERSRIHSYLENTFHFDVKVTLIDEQTEEVIPYFKIYGPSSSSDEIFRQSTSFTGGSGSRNIRGIAYQPREFGFSADGYERKNVLVTSDTESSMTVVLKPKSNPVAGQ